MTGTPAYDGMVPPLGGRGLLPLAVTAELREPALAQASLLPRLELSGRAYGDLTMLGMGGFTPLSGFMNRICWQSVCEGFTLPDGQFWPMPVLLDVPADSAKRMRGAASAALTYRGRIAGVITVEDVWTMDERDCWHEAELVYRGSGKDSLNFRELAPSRHPGVAHVLGRERTFVSGSVTVLEDAANFYGLSADDAAVVSPAAFRAQAAAQGWRNVVCMQLRNPPHRSHEYLMRIGLEVSDALLIHTPVGALKAGDLPADVRLRAIRALVGTYLPKERVVIAGYPLDMRYAGPREALLHAAFRQNYGISAQIVGRDHAGVADFYSPFEAQDIFARIPAAPSPDKALLTKALKIKWPFYCKKCDSMATLNSCPHDMEDRVFHSGSMLRKYFADRTVPPADFIRAEVFAILAEHYAEQPLDQRVILYGAADGSSLK